MKTFVKFSARNAESHGRWQPIHCGFVAVSRSTRWAHSRHTSIPQPQPTGFRELLLYFSQQMEHSIFAAVVVVVVVR
jgi:hypothetical protein